MQRLAPNAWARFRAIPPDASHSPRIRQRIIERHRELLRLKEHEPGQYDAEVERLRLEDDILGTANRLRVASDDAAEPLKKELREKVRRLVELRIRNREARIARLAKALDREREKLENDKLRLEQAVERKFNAVVNGTKHSRRLFGNPGGGGGGGGPRRGPAGGGRPPLPDAPVAAPPAGSPQETSEPRPDPQPAK